MVYIANIMRSLVCLDTDLVNEVRAKIKEFKEAGYKGIPVVYYHSSNLSDRITSNPDHICGYGIEISDFGDIEMEIVNTTPGGRYIENYLLHPDVINDDKWKPFAISANCIRLPDGTRKVINCILE